MKANWKKLTIATIAGAVLLTASAVVFSQRPDGGFQGPPPGGGGFRGPGGPRDGLGPLGRDLNLTEEQKAQIKKIQDSFRESDKALHEQMRALMGNQPDPASTEFNEAAVRSAAEARAKIQVELEVSRAKMMSQVAAVLTDEQKAQLAARRQQFQRQGPPPPPPDQP